jgi:hypothetical protein
MRAVDRVSMTIGGVSRPLRSRPLVWIDDMAATGAIGQPSDYAETGDQIRLWAKPNSAYPLNFIGIVDLSALSADSDSNAWTVQGYDLITARTKFTLYRDQFKDADGAATAANAESQALAKLQGETARRLSSGMAAYG